MFKSGGPRELERRDKRHYHRAMIVTQNCELSVMEMILYDSLTFENKVVEAAAKVSLATVYQKHSFLRTRKWMYRR